MRSDILYSIASSDSRGASAKNTAELDFLIVLAHEHIIYESLSSSDWDRTFHINQTHEAADVVFSVEYYI